MNDSPRSWDDVSLGRYMQLVAIPATCTAQERSLRTVAVLTGRSLAAVKAMPVSEYRAVASGLAFTNSQPEGGFSRTVDVKGRTYSLVDDLTQVTLGELIDLEEYSSDWSRSMHLALAVLFRESGPDGSRADYNPSACAALALDLLDCMSARQAHATSVFFSLVAGACLSRTRASSESRT